jgi:hypothetical protein
MGQDTSTTMGTAVSSDQLNAPFAADPKMPMTDYTRFMGLLQTEDACSNASALAPLLTVVQQDKKFEEFTIQTRTV